MTKSKRMTVVLLVALIGLVCGVASVQAQEEFKETHEAFAVSMGTSNPPVVPAGVTTTLQINITRWSTDEEREALFVALSENGPKGMASTLSKQKETGWARATGRAQMMNPFPSERLRYARDSSTWAKVSGASCSR